MSEFIAGLTITGLLIENLVIFVSGAVALLFYMIWRMMRTIGDDSNMNNPLRLLSQATIHPEDFGRMYYLTKDQMALFDKAATEIKRLTTLLDQSEMSISDLKQLLETQTTEGERKDAVIDAAGKINE